MKRRSFLNLLVAAPIVAALSPLLKKKEPVILLASPNSEEATRYLLKRYLHSIRYGMRLSPYITDPGAWFITPADKTNALSYIRGRNG